MHFLLTLSFWLLDHNETLHKFIKSDRNFKFLLLYLLEIYLHCYKVIEPDKRFKGNTPLIVDHTELESYLNKHVSEFEAFFLNYSFTRGRDDRIGTLLFVSLNYKKDT
jgi:hypothetical protein